MYKPRWGVFYQTPLREHLNDLCTNTLLICGCNFPNCPQATIYEASERDFRVVLVTDATSGVYERGLRELGNIGVNLVDSDSCLNELGVEEVGQSRAWEVRNKNPRTITGRLDAGLKPVVLPGHATWQTAGPVKWWTRRLPLLPRWTFLSTVRASSRLLKPLVVVLLQPPFTRRNRMKAVQLGS